MIVELRRQSRIVGQKFLQRTIQRPSDTNGCCQKYIKLSRLNPLNIPNIQVSNFGKSLLTDVFGQAFSADICAKSFQPE
jgi:hypothetical protein